MSSIRNVPVKLNISFQKNEIHPSPLEQSLDKIAKAIDNQIDVNSLNADDIMALITDELSKVTTDKHIFLERTYSLCDAVQPFGRQDNDAITAVTKHIQSLLDKSHSRYFKTQQDIKLRYDISSILNIALKNGDNISQNILNTVRRADYEISVQLIKANLGGCLIEQDGKYLLSSAAQYAVRDRILPKLFSKADFALKNIILRTHLKQVIDKLKTPPINRDITNTNIAKIETDSKFLNELKGIKLVSQLTLDGLMQKLEDGSYEGKTQETLCSLYNAWIKNDGCLSTDELCLFHQFVTGYNLEDYANGYTCHDSIYFTPNDLNNGIVLDNNSAITSVLVNFSKKAATSFAKVASQDNKIVSLIPKNNAAAKVTGAVKIYDSQYHILKTPGIGNDCLMYAASDVWGLTRKTVFTAEAIKVHLNKMYKVKKTEFELGNSLSTFLSIVEDRYLGCSFIQTRESIGALAVSDESLTIAKNIEAVITCMARELANYICTSRCFLDVQIAAPILAAYLGRELVIVQPDITKKNASGHLFTLIDLNEELPSSMELTKENFEEVEKYLNEKGVSPLFIYNKNGTHFERMQKVASCVVVSQESGFKSSLSAMSGGDELFSSIGDAGAVETSDDSDNEVDQAEASASRIVGSNQPKSSDRPSYIDERIWKAFSTEGSRDENYAKLKSALTNWYTWFGRKEVKKATKLIENLVDDIDRHHYQQLHETEKDLLEKIKQNLAQINPDKFVERFVIGTLHTALQLQNRQTFKSNLRNLKLVDELLLRDL